MNEQDRQRNNDCLDMGTLVSLRDGELPADEQAKALAHIATCPDCAADDRAVSVSSRDTYELLASIGPGEHEVPSTAGALAAMQARLDAEGLGQDRRGKGAISLLKPGVPRAGRSVKQRRIGWLAAAIAAALAVLLLLPNAGALASQFLALFQVQKFQPVAVSPQDFSQAFLLDIAKYGQIDESNFDTGLQPVSESQARQMIHFPLLLPGHLPPGVGQSPDFEVTSGGVVTFIFKASMARAYLQQNGINNVTIPAQLDGATYTITVQPGVVINYVKNCPAGGTNGKDSLLPGQCGGVPFYMAEIPSPVVQGVGNASLETLRNFFISLPGQSSQVRTLLADVNLQTGTVPLPIPPQVNAQQITIQGAPGVVLADNALNLGALLWQTGGIIYAVATESSNTAELMNVVNSLH